jgi:heme/copper-type cytochrome/quinol oxidase subunit 1
MKPKRIIIELIILIAIYLLAYFIWPVLFGTIYGNMALDINLHDTYFVMSASPWQMLILCTFSVLSILIYFIRAIVKRYKNNIVNIILIISNFVLIIMLIKIYRIILLLEQTMDSKVKGWTIYPPLSGLGNMPHPITGHPHFDSYMFIPITVFMLILVISSIITGKNWKINTHEQSST